MPRAGALNQRVTFQRRAVGADDGYGNVLQSWADLVTVWGSLQIEDGREAVRAGRVQSASGGVLRVRVGSLTDGITEADRAVIDGTVWNIRSKDNRDQRSKFYEMRVEKGVAT